VFRPPELVIVVVEVVEKAGGQKQTADCRRISARRAPTPARPIVNRRKADGSGTGLVGAKTTL
jgi:hypothetical protein